MPHLIENSDEDSSEEEGDEESFRTKQLFSFAWQIAKGMVITVIFYCSFFLQNMPGRNAYNGLQGEDSPEKSALFRFPTRKGRDFISFEVYERIRKSVISSLSSVKRPKRANRRILWLWKSREISRLYDLLYYYILLLHIALSQSETLTSSLLSVFSRDLRFLSAYNKFVSSAKR